MLKDTAILAVLVLLLFVSCSVEQQSRPYESLESTEAVYRMFVDANAKSIPQNHIVSSYVGSRNVEGPGCPEAISARAGADSCSGLLQYYTRSFLRTDQNGSFINITVLLFETEQHARTFFEETRSNYEISTDARGSLESFEQFVVYRSLDEPSSIRDWSTIDRGASAHLRSNVVLVSSFISATQSVSISDFDSVSGRLCDMKLGCNSDAECGPSGTCGALDASTCTRGCEFR